MSRWEQHKPPHAKARQTSVEQPFWSTQSFECWFWCIFCHGACHVWHQCHQFGDMALCFGIDRHGAVKSRGKGGYLRGACISQRWSQNYLIRTFLFLKKNEFLRHAVIWRKGRALVSLILVSSAPAARSSGNTDATDTSPDAGPLLYPHSGA